MKHKYVGGVYHTPLTIFERLDEVGIHVPEEDRYFPFRATFDFEAYFSERNLPEGTDLLQWNAKHVSLSVSIASNVPGFLKPLCIINEKGVEVKKFLIIPINFFLRSFITFSLFWKSPKPSIFWNLFSLT